MQNNGFNNEIEICSSINNKKFKSINDFMKELIVFMYGPIDKNTIIHSEKYDPFEKADIYFEVNGIRKFVSIKSGKTKSIHSEGIKTFILFLRSLGVSVETQKTILLFQYGDGTLDGTGDKRLTHDELMIIMKNQIENANKELNNENIIKETVDRFVFTGGYGEKAKTVDFILYGTKDHGVFVSKKELLDYALKRKTEYIRTLHIGPITIRPYMRDIERKSLNPYKRDIVHGDWKDLNGDMMVIEGKRNKISNSNIYYGKSKKKDLFDILRLDRHHRSIK